MASIRNIEWHLLAISTGIYPQCRMASIRNVAWLLSAMSHDFCSVRTAKKILTEFSAQPQRWPQITGSPSGQGNAAGLGHAQQTGIMPLDLVTVSPPSPRRVTESNVEDFFNTSTLLEPAPTPEYQNQIKPE